MDELPEYGITFAREDDRLTFIDVHDMMAGASVLPDTVEWYEWKPDVLTLATWVPWGVAKVLYDKVRELEEELELIREAIGREY